VAGNELLKEVYRLWKDPTYRLQRLERGVQTQRAGSLVTPSGNYSKFPAGILDSKGRLPIYNTVVTKQGSVPPAGSTLGFSYASTDTTIHLYWDGTNGSKQIVIYRADGTRFAVPTGDILVTGLSATTTYYFLPYWDPTTNSCSIGFVPGTVGSPKIFFTTNADAGPIQSQALQHLEPLSNGYASVITAAGGGTGTGGGIGCVMQGTDIETLGGHPYTCDVLPEARWLRFTTKSGKSLNCSGTHRLYLEDGLVEASGVRPGDRAVTIDGVEEIVHVDQFTRVCSKLRVRMGYGHLYWANGFLSHNMKQYDGTP
jgi:hypothetical protein